MYRIKGHNVQCPMCNNVHVHVVRVKVRSFNKLPTCADVLILFTLQKNTLYIDVQSSVKVSFLMKITFVILSVIR
jgi:hypothetical protein